MVGACQQNSGIFLIRGGGPELEICEGRRRAGAGDLRGQAAGSERPGTGRDAGGGRGRDWDKMPATKSPGRQRARSGPGLGRDTGGDRG